MRPVFPRLARKSEVDIGGFDPPTSRMRSVRSTNWAKRPYNRIKSDLLGFPVPGKGTYQYIYIYKHIYTYVYIYIYIYLSLSNGYAYIYLIVCTSKQVIFKWLFMHIYLILKRPSQSVSSQLGCTSKQVISKTGHWGLRSLYLTHAKRALYQLS